MVKWHPIANGVGVEEVGLMRRSRRMWLRICGLTLPPAAIAAVAAATTVFACTNVMGPLSITPTTGPAGTVISTTASGLVKNATYAMHFAKTTSGNCMSFKGVLTLGYVTADGSGDWSNVSFVIPSTASMGAHSTCGIETRPVKAGSGTTHDTFTVM